MERQSSPESGKRWPFRRSGRPRPLRTVAMIPTLITLGNGVCGVIAIFKIGMGLDVDGAKYFTQAAWLILAGMVFDALDGFVARMTKTASAFGAQLDSLCDLITFGVAPGFLVFAATRGQFTDFWERPVQIVGGLFAMCALIRLARFTVETTPDESSHREFAGLPSPAAAGVIASAVLPSAAFQKMAPEVVAGIHSALPGLTLATAILMVSRVRYSHVINRLLRGRRPFVLLVEIAFVAALAVIVREFALFVAFFGYALSGPILWVRRRFSRRPTPAVPGATPPPERKDATLF